MIEINCKYDRDILTNLYNRNKLSTTILMYAFSIVLLLCGVVNIIRQYQNILEVILGVILIIASPCPFIISKSTKKKFIANLIKDFGVEKHPMEMNFKFLDKQLHITVTQCGKSKVNKIPYADIYMLRSEGDSMVIQLDKQLGFLICNQQFISGDFASLKRLLKSKDVVVK